MPEQMPFYFVFLCQVLLISFFFPRRVLSLSRHVLATYPPSKYPRLYSRPIDYYERVQRRYRNMNLFALVVGLVLVFIGVYSPTEEMLSWDSSSVLTIYFFLQWSPMIIAATGGFAYFSTRRADSRSTRKAELHPRRLFDFVSPTMLGIAVFVYFAFVLLILYIRQFDYPWFGGYGNIFGVTALNLVFAGAVIRILYGKRKDPYQAYEDRRREIAVTTDIMFFSSIGATAFIALNVILRALDLHDLTPLLQSLYFQLIAMICLRAFRIENVDFEVYKEESLST